MATNTQYTKIPEIDRSDEQRLTDTERRLLTLAGDAMLAHQKFEMLLDALESYAMRHDIPIEEDYRWAMEQARDGCDALQPIVEWDEDSDHIYPIEGYRQRQ